MKAGQLRCSLLELISDKSNLDGILSAGVVAKIGEFEGFISSLQQELGKMQLPQFINLVADRSGMITDLLSLDTNEAQSRKENIEELAASAYRYQAAEPGIALSNYLEEISLYIDIDNYSQQEDMVTLMTLHGAKGLEFESVVIAGLEDGLFPLARCLDYPQLLEEERRLMYVGMTRAKSKLTLSYALRRARLGGRSTIRSRFVDELPDESVETLCFAMLDLQGRVNVDYTEPEIQLAGDPFAAIKVGSIVFHPRWGEGRVSNRAGCGDATEFEVRFTYAGLKKLRAKYAKLRLVR